MQRPGVDGAIGQKKSTTNEISPELRPLKPKTVMGEPSRRPRLPSPSETTAETRRIHGRRRTGRTSSLLARAAPCRDRPCGRAAPTEARGREAELYTGYTAS